MNQTVFCCREFEFGVADKKFGVFFLLTALWYWREKKTGYLCRGIRIFSFF
jgi:hypothetical protein